MLLAMTYISNLLFSTALDHHSLFKASTKSLLKLNHLYILDLIVYIFIYKKKRKKSQVSKIETKEKKKCI